MIQKVSFIGLFVLLLCPCFSVASVSCPNLSGVYQCGEEGVPYLLSAYDRVILSQAEVGLNTEYTFKTKGPDPASKPSDPVFWIADEKDHAQESVVFPLTETVMERSYRALCVTSEPWDSFLILDETWKAKDLEPNQHFTLSLGTSLLVNAHGDLEIRRSVNIQSSADASEANGDSPKPVSVTDVVCKRVVK